MQELNELDLLLQKNKLNKTQSKTASNLLTQIYKDNISTACEYLMKLPLDVTTIFFTQNYSNIMKGDSFNDITNSLTSLDLFQKNTRDCSVLRCLTIINICLNNKNYGDYVCDLFVTMLNFAMKNNVAKPSFLTNINKKLIANQNLDFLKLQFKNDDKFQVLLLVQQLSDTQNIDVTSNEFTSLNIYNDYISNKDKLIETLSNSSKKTNDKTTISSLKSTIDEQNITIQKLTNELELLKRLLEDEKKKTNDLVANLELSFGMN